MKEDMYEECLISPRREKGEIEIPGTTLFCPNPADLHRLERLSKSCSTKQMFMYNARLWRISSDLGSFNICGPAVGAPMAVLILEKLAALGSRNIIVIGTCGAISDDLSIGDVLLPEFGVSEEGTSLHYPLNRRSERKNVIVAGLKRCLHDAQIDFANGKIWTTDAPYRETHEKVERYRRLGVRAVDMEYTALKTVADFRQIDLAAIMVVSDSLSGRQWVPGFSNKLFKEKCGDVCTSLFNCCLSGEL